MKLRLPLYARILGLFLVNVLVIAGVFLVVFRMQFHLGLDSLLAGQANQRVQALTRAVLGELQNTPADKHDDVLNRFAEAYGVELYLFRPDGTQVAGTPVTLPPEIAREIRHPQAGQRRGQLRSPDGEQNIEPQLEPPPALAPPPPVGEAEEDSLQRHLPAEASSSDMSPGSRGPRNRQGGLRLGRRWQEADAAFRRPASFFLKTKHPTRYWAGTIIPGRFTGRPAQPLVLLIASDSLSGGGLFFESTPWLIVSGGALVLSALIWLPFVRSITRSLGQMTQTTEQISVGQFDARVTTSRSDELGRLAEAINRMSSRLEGYVHGQKRFLGDIAHELCSPLARIQTALGILEQRADPRHQSYVKDLQEEAEHMSALVGELLSFSKASLNRSKSPLQSVRLMEVISQAVRREQVEGVEIQQQIPDDLHALADPELLQRAVANLLRNAVRYAGQAGPIAVAGMRHGSEVVLEVSDSGPGVPEESLEKLFDPFYRVDASRTRETGGVGLGMTIVKTCVESCGGTVTASNRPEGGLCVRMHLQASGN